MKYLKAYESAFSFPFNKKIADFIESTKQQFKDEVDECMYDLLDEFKNTSGFYDDDDEDEREVGAFYHLFIPIGNVSYTGTFESDLTSCLNRLVDFKSDFNIRVTYYRNIDFANIGRDIQSSNSSILGTTYIEYINNNENVKDMVNSICEDISNVHEAERKLNIKFDHVAISFNIW